MLNREAIEQVRRFNRIAGECIGANDDHFLGRGRPMGESRVLWEIGDGAEVRALRARLGLDSGYLTRVLQSLTRQGLVRVKADGKDGRVRHATLTAKGSAERTELDRRSEALAADMLSRLSPAQRDALLTAMARVERLLRAGMVRFEVEPPTTADARWCLQQYFAELNTRFEAGFDPALSNPADARDMTPPAGVFLVARLRGRPIGCGALKFHGSRPAELRRMWIAPDARGLGVGGRLLAELEQRARASSASAVHLETNRSLREAIALYRRSGYTEVPRFNDEPYAHHWFEKQL